MEKIKSNLEFKMPAIMKENFFTRLASILFFAPLFLWITYEGGFYFHTSLAVIGVICLWEWQRVVGHRNFKWIMGGSIYISLAIFGLIYVPQKANVFLQTTSGLSTHTAYLFLIYTIVWATDCGAYITGKIFKGPKLCPTISPNKTWAGFIGGICFAIIFTSILKYTLDIHINISFSIILITALLSVAAHLGDLIESAVKRHFNVKDVSQLIPGHGGVLDRLDSLLFIGIITLIIVVLCL